MKLWGNSDQCRAKCAGSLKPDVNLPIDNWSPYVTYNQSNDSSYGSYIFVGRVWRSSELLALLAAYYVNWSSRIEYWIFIQSLVPLTLMCSQVNWWSISQKDHNYTSFRDALWRYMRKNDDALTYGLGQEGLRTLIFQAHPKQAHVLL